MAKKYQVDMTNGPLLGKIIRFSMPLMLGSIAAAAIFLVYFPIIAVRIRNEEAVLAEGLPGYRAYCQRVRYRLLPFIW